MKKAFWIIFAIVWIGLLVYLFLINPNLKKRGLIYTTDGTYYGTYKFKDGVCIINSEIILLGADINGEMQVMYEAKSVQNFDINKAFSKDTTGKIIKYTNMGYSVSKKGTFNSMHMYRMSKTYTIPNEQIIKIENNW